MSSKNKAKIIEHHQASNYATHFATGVILSGHGAPPPNQPDHAILQLTFYDDAITVTQEHVATNKNGTISTSVDNEDVMTYREDKVRICMTRASARELFTVLTLHFTPADVTNEAVS